MRIKKASENLKKGSELDLIIFMLFEIYERIISREVYYISEIDIKVNAALGRTRNFI